MRIFILVLITVNIIVGCKKNNGVPVNDIPGGQTIGAHLFNCTNIKVKTMWASAELATNNTSQSLLGSTNTADYGTTYCNLFAKYVIDQTKFAQENLANNELVSDASLYLKIDNIYGSNYANGDSMQVTVYGSDVDLPTTSYNSTSFSPYTTSNANVLFSGYINFNLDKKVSYAGKDTLATLIRIKLNTTKLNNQLSTNVVNGTTNTNYNVADFYKNIVIVPTGNGKNFVAKTSMLNYFSSVVVTTYTNGATKQYILLAPTSLTPYAHNIINAKDVSTNITKSVTNTDSTLAFMQGGVSNGKLFLNDLNSLMDSGNMVINTAKLTITPTYTSTDNYAPTTTYNLGFLKPDGSINPIKDLIYESSVYFNGTYSSTANSISFNIARHIQEVVSKQLPNYPLVLVSALQAINTNITIIKNNNVQLNITYTKVK
ncbi:MAG: hypothetical protein H7331_02595 [Bacteroidia bacterium]|nr:hypothetical protein [Bacteroidia bacterium]